jgi:hypothetical protein
MKHKHHIIPRHAGGSDDPSNLIELTVEEHAEAHRLLYEQYGRWQDKIAWETLSGHIGKEEAIKSAQGAANRGRKRTPEQCERIRQAAIERNKRWAENPEIRAEARRKTSEAMKGKKKSKEAIDAWRESKANGAGFSHSLETKIKIAKSLEGNQNRKK